MSKSYDRIHKHLLKCGLLPNHANFLGFEIVFVLYEWIKKEWESVMHFKVVSRGIEVTIFKRT